MSKTVLSYGGTGVQGGAATRAFAAAGFTTRTVTRNPSSEGARALKDAGIEVYSGDLGDTASLKAAHEGVQVVSLVVPFFVQPPNSPADYMRNAVQTAQDANVDLLIWNTSGPMPEERLGRNMVDYRQDLHDVLKASGVPYIMIAPGSYMENLMGPWTAGGIRDADELAYPIPDGQRLSWITVNDVAKFIVQASTRPNLAGSVFRVSGPENLTGPEMAARFSSGLGREITWRQLTPREFGDQIGEVMGPQAGDMLAEDYGFINENMTKIMPFHEMTPVLEKLPVRLTTLETWVRDHAAAFQRA